MIKQFTLTYCISVLPLITAWCALADPAAPSATTVALAPAQETLADITGTLEIVQVCYVSPPRSERWYRVSEEKTGQVYKLKFALEPAEGHLTGERVRIRGYVQGEEVRVPAITDTAPAGLEVLAAAPPQTNGLTKTFNPKSLYGGGATSNTVIHQTLVMLVNYTNSAPWTAANILSISNEFFSTTGSSVNTDYLEDTYGAIGFAGKVIICSIAASNGPCDTSAWTSQANAQAVAQGENPGAYAHQVYVVSGACGWAGLATVGGSWVQLFYTDGGTSCHELGHNLGFNHASAQWNNTSAWDEYGDSSDFMGGSYDWRHNNGPHKVQMGWLKSQPVTRAGTYQVWRVEDDPATVSLPQVLTVPSSAPPNGWPYYFSYKQSVGFDANVGGYNKGLSIHRWSGGNTAAISILSDGGAFTDGNGLTVRQLGHDTNSVTVVIITCVGEAQPYTVVMTSAQLAARTTILADVAGTCDLMTITNFDPVSAKGGAVTLTNNQLFYTPPGLFGGNDTFGYTVVNSSGQPSSATVTIYNLSQPSFNWDPNGATVDAGRTGTWDTASTNWDNGTSVWPGSGTANWALFGGTAGTVSIASAGASANGLDFKTSGYLVQNNTLTLNGTSPTVLVEPNLSAAISSVVAGTASLTKLGEGALTLNGNNTYSGSTVVNAGTLVLNTPNFNTYSGGGIYINNGSTLRVTTTGGVNRYDFTSKSFTFDSAGGGTIDTSSGVNFVLWTTATFTTSGGAQDTIIGSSGLNNNNSCTFNVARGTGVSDLKVASRIWNTGSVVKTGTGILEFAANNTYSGSTTVAAGELLLSSAQTGTNAISVSDGATLSVTVSGTNQLSPSVFTLGSGGGTLTCEFSGVSSTSIAPVNTAALTLNGVTTINITDGALAAGQVYPLISFTNISGTGGFVVGTLSSGTYGVDAAVITNGNSIALSVTAVAPIAWAGNVNGTWDIAATANWTSNGLAATYADGLAVQFDDTASGANTVSNAAPVSPRSLVVSNSAKNYTIGGSPISGYSTLAKLGAGTLTLAGANTFNGGAFLVAGRLNLGQASAAGSGPLTINGGTLDNTSGSPMALAANNDQSWNGSFTFAGSANLNLGTGTVAVGAPVTLTVGANTLTIGGNITGNGQNFTFIGAGTTTFSGNNTGLGSVGVGSSAPSVGNWTVTGGSDTFTSFSIGYANGTASGNSYPGVYRQSGGTVTCNASDNLVVGQGNNANQTLTGSFIQTGGAFYDNSQGVYLGNFSAALLDISGNSIFTSSQYGATVGLRGATTVNIGGSAVVTMPTISFNGWGSWGNAGHGVLNLNGGVLAVTGVGKNTGSTATNTFNFNGGILRAISSTPGATGHGNPLTDFMGGGTYGSLNAAYVKEGGAKIDSQGFSITISQPLKHGGVAVTDGGLLKLGSGALTLSGAESYTGPTVVSNGTLIVTGSLGTNGVVVQSGATLGGTGTINGATTINPGAVLAPGVAGLGTNTFTGALTLAGAVCMEIVKVGTSCSSDLLVKSGQLTYGGLLSVTNLGGANLAAGDTFKLFSAGSYAGAFATNILPALPVGLAWDLTPLSSNGTVRVAAVPYYTLTYAAGPNGSLLGVTTQWVNYGASGTAVTAQPNAGYAFTNWSDGSLANPRADANVTNNLSVTANFLPLGIAVWSGAGSDGNWSTANNWGGTAPMNGQGLTFQGGLRQSNTNDLLNRVGQVVFNNGAFTLAGSPVLMQSGILNVAGNNTWAIGSTLDNAQSLVSSNGTLTVSGAITNNGYALTLDGPATNLLSAAISGAGGLAKLGSGKAFLSGSNGFTGPVVISAGTLQVGDGTTNGSLASPTITNNASLVFSRSDLIDINTAISGAGSLTANAGTGEIGFRGSVSAGSVAATSTFASSAQALFGSSYAAAINLFANIATTGNQTYTGVVSIGRGSGNPTTVLTTTGGGNVTLSGGVVSGVANYWSAGTLTIDTSAGSGNVTLAGMTLSYGVGNLNIKSGTGTITLTGGNYYYDYSVFNGNVALTGNAIFQPANQWVRGVTINGDLTGGYTLTASLGNGAASTTGTGVAGLLFSNTTAHTVSCVIAGSSGLTKNGAGTLSLTGANTYSGATTISAGKLQVNGSLAASSAVTVSAAGTLGGTGTVNGTVTLSGAIAPGASVGTLSTGAETWNGGASYACEINSTNASGCDRLNITGALNVQATAGAPFTVKLASLTAGNTPGPLGSFNKFRNYTWTIATASGGVQNFATNSFALDTSSFSNDFSGGAFSLAVAGNNLVVNYKAAPSVPPWFSAIASLGSGGMQLGGTGGVGQVYVLLSATNLAPSVWIPIATNTANANGVFQFTDPQATNYVERFYRAVSP